MKRLNAHIVKLEEQIARALIIHQLLGNRISDTLTMRKDCLYKKDNQDMVIIYQPKSRRFEKPVSAEVAQLIKKAIVYAEQNYKESIYIESSRTSSKRVQKTQFCIVFKPVNPGDCEGVVQFNAEITGIFIMQKVEADRSLSALQDVDTIRKKEKKQ